MFPKYMRKRTVTYGSQALVSTLLFMGIVVFVALIAERHFLRWDLTKNRAHTLSEQSQKIIESITEPVHILGFFATNESRNEAEDLLETYRYYNSKISYEFIDPDRNPEMAKKYEIRTYGTLVIEGYGKKETIQNATEEGITNALLKLNRDEKKKIYFLIGHGEHSIEEFGKTGYSTVKSSLEKENYEVSTLNLMTKKSVPDDGAMVIISGPKTNLFPEEIERLDEFVKNGGKVVVMLDPYQDAGLKGWLARYGIALYDDVIIDKLSRVFGGSYLLPVVTQYGFHPITKDFTLATFYPEARSIREAKEVPEFITLTTLAQTSEGAWAETNREMLQQGQAIYDENEDILGPVPIVVLSQIDVAGLVERDQKIEATSEKQKKGYILAMGDSDFVDNTYFGLAGNGDFFLNAMHYLAEEETLITIEPRKQEGQPLLLTQYQMRLILFVSMILVPLLILIFSIGVYRVRRAQR